MAAKAKKPNRHTKSDIRFVKHVWAQLARVYRHDRAIANQSDGSNSSPVPIIDDGPDGPNAKAFENAMGRLQELHFFWTGKLIA